MRTFYDTIALLPWVGVGIVVFFLARTMHIVPAIMSIDWQAVLHMVGM